MSFLIGPRLSQGYFLAYKNLLHQTHHFSPLASQIARRTNGIEAPMDRGLRLGLGKRTLAGSLSGPVHVNDEPGLSHPVEQATGGSKRVPGEQILLKVCAQGFHTLLVKGGKEAGERRTMRQQISPKERHIRLCEWQEPFVKCPQGRFTAESIAD